MSNVVRFSTRVTTAPATPSNKAEATPLVSIVLFCGIGLLVSVAAILLGIPGLWI